MLDPQSHGGIADYHGGRGPELLTPREHKPTRSHADAGKRGCLDCRVLRDHRRAIAFRLPDLHLKALGTDHRGPFGGGDILGVDRSPTGIDVVLPIAVRGCTALGAADDPSEFNDVRHGCDCCKDITGRSE